MTGLTIYRGTHQIGGCCTEISADGKRILIDFGANLLDTDETSPLPDQKLTAQVFDGRPTEAVLFTHYHGDHYGLFKSIPKNVPLYIGPVAKQILKALVPYIDLGEGKGPASGQRYENLSVQRVDQTGPRHPCPAPVRGPLRPGRLYVLYRSRREADPVHRGFPGLRHRGGKGTGLADAGRLCPSKHRPAHHRGHHAQPRAYSAAGPLVR